MELNSNSGVLDRCHVYLSGPINFAKDHGLMWRKDFKELCNNYNLNFVFFDPTDKPKSLGDEVNREKEIAAKYRKEKDWDGLQKHAKRFVRTDLRLCDLSDIIIAYIDKDVFMTGTWHEVIVGLQQKKPVLFIVKQGKEGAPDWLFGISDHNYIFDTVEDCVKYLSSLNNGDIELSQLPTTKVVSL
jgi:nucleoside 2-deoxyribosyltransferase